MEDKLKVEITVEDNELQVDTNVPGLVAISLLTSGIEVITDDLLKQASTKEQEQAEQVEQAEEE